MSEAKPGVHDLEERQGIIDLVNRMNMVLVDAGKEGADQTFGVGIALGSLSVLVAVILLYAFHVVDFILALIIFIFGVAVMIWVASNFAKQVRTRRIQEAYDNRVETEINLYLRRHNIDFSQFSELTKEVLPEGAPLRAILISSMSKNSP